MLGKQIQLGGRDEKAPWITIVGVVGDVRQHALDLEAAPQVYLAHAQSNDPPNYMTLVVRGTTPAGVIADDVRRFAAEMDPGVPVYGTESMSARVADSLARRSFLLELFGLFAGTALLLAAIGVHGMVAHAVRRRTREFGLRRAVGASDRAVLMLASARATRYFVAGVVLGLPLAFAWGHFMTAELYGVSQYDTISVVLVVLALAVVIGLLDVGAAAARAAYRPDGCIAQRMNETVNAHVSCRVARYRKILSCRRRTRLGAAQHHARHRRRRIHQRDGAERRRQELAVERARSDGSRLAAATTRWTVLRSRSSMRSTASRCSATRSLSSSSTII